MCPYGAAPWRAQELVSELSEEGSYRNYRALMESLRGEAYVPHLMVPLFFLTFMEVCAFANALIVVVVCARARARVVCVCVGGGGQRRAR